MRKAARDPVDRFWEKVHKTDGCWAWNARINSEGYGEFRYLGRMMKAHRVALLLQGIDLGDSLVCHRCDNRKCVRPDHLFLGDYNANQQDCARKVRFRGQKLTPDQAVSIKSAIRGGIPSVELARDYGVTQQTICDIKHGRSWAHVN
jgi:hypothetical protein